MAKFQIVVVFDRSGSMSALKSDAVGGFNEFLNQQKKVGDDASLTLTFFSNSVSVHYKDKPIAEVQPLSLDEYQPMGATALNDAIGQSIMSASENPNTIFVIQTDGYENASTAYTRSAINAMITEKTKQGWTFLYLGANQDAMAESASMGISGANTASYSTMDSYSNTRAFYAASNVAAASRKGLVGESMQNAYTATASLVKDNKLVIPEPPKDASPPAP